ncbi:hypothetical protein ACFYOF_16890 [Streptomyces sp. NPDC007148]|uniref:hypothetical protein n=1 Tax=Streptomyces sp. NPDC007148 TaxID=3364775 RepID=UPI0036B2D07E
MTERTDQPLPQPTPAPLAPRPNPILAEAATVENCAGDYAAGADVRATLAAQEARARR